MAENQSAKPPLILVLGAGKSGTTALFFCLKASAERHFAMTFPFRFEPKSAAVIDAFPAEFGIAKMLLERYERTSNEFVSRFDKRVFILRDLAPHLGKKTISPVEISEYLQRQLGS